MRAVLKDTVIAESADTIACKGYDYFRRTAVRMDLLEKTERTPRDLECPHGVQFYDVVLGGVRYPRAAWSYEAPRPEMAAVENLMGFWQDVEVGP